MTIRVNWVTIEKMLAVIVCLGGVAAILGIAEVLWRRNILKGENQRKFVHVGVFTFIAFWPWLISWQTIRIIALAMFVATLINRAHPHLHYSGEVKRVDYGDVLMPLAIIICSLITDEKIFFCLAILQVSLADGFAAVVGKNFGKYWRYKVFHQEKTVIGSMTFWLISLCIIGAGILLAQNLISYSSYYYLLLLLPPALTALENFAVLGLDNIAVPIAALVAINLARTL